MPLPTVKVWLIALLILVGAYAKAQPAFENSIHVQDYEAARSILQTKQGNYVMIGHTTASNFPHFDILLIKTNAHGDTIWTRTYGGTEYDTGYDLVQTEDSGFLLIGYTKSFGAEDSDILLIKTNHAGMQLWQKTFGGPRADWGQALIKDRAGGYIFTGRIYDPDSSWNVIIAKVDELGNLVWQKVYGGKEADAGNDIIQTSDRGFLVCGSALSFGEGKYDIYLVKTDASGDSLWTRTYGGAENDAAMAVQQTSDGGYILAGYTFSYGAGDADIYLLKLNSSGDTLWTRTFGGPAYDISTDILIHPAGGYVITGYGESYNPAAGINAYLLKTSAEGDSLWFRDFGGPDTDYSSGLCRSHDGAYVMTGMSFHENNSRGWSDVLHIKAYVPPDSYEQNQFKLGLFPNPNRGSFEIRSSLPIRKVQVFDSRGRIVYSKDNGLPFSRTFATSDLTDFKPGVYYARIHSLSGYHYEAFVLH